MNKKALGKLLYINPSSEVTIFDVLGRMKVLLEFFKRNPKHKNLVPFLKTYYLITKSVAERSLEHKKYFQNIENLHKLDVYFANLYFRPLRTYLLTGQSHAPWKTYFEYCQSKVGTPFVQLILGINAHINTDLLTTIIALRYKSKKDFWLINTILREEVPVVMKFLAFVSHDFYGWGGLLFKGFAMKEFHDLIVKWRVQVWKNSLICGPREIYTLSFKKNIAMQTENIGHDLIRIFDTSKALNPVKLASELNKLRIKL